MNENTLPPRENESAASSEDARVLAPPDNASRDNEVAPFREASDEHFSGEQFSSSATFGFAASSENAAPVNAPPFDAATPGNFSMADAAPPKADVRNADARNTAAQNVDAPLSNAASDAEENAPSHNATVAPPRVEDGASTRDARAGVAALIARVSPRIVTALIGIPLVLLIVWQGGALLTGITVLLALTAMRELIDAARKNKTPLVIEWCYFMLLFSMIALWNTMPLWREAAGDYDGPPPYAPMFPSLLHLAWPLLSLLFVPVWLLLWGVIRYAKKRVTLSSIALSTLAIFYVALFEFWPMLRDLTNGLALFVLLLGGVWAGDSAAYFAGRALGKTRLTPLSPGKTREGIVASCVATLLVCLMLAGALQIDFRHGVAIGILIAVFAPLGDLVESLWKRELGVKDFGAILPGHGGVLDRCDSLLLTAPIVFVYALWQAL